MAVFGLCLAADWFSKKWALAHLSAGESRPFLPGFLQLTLTANPGAAFSLGSHNGQAMGILATALTICLLVWIGKSVFSKAPLPVVQQVGMGCLLGGAVGNLVDRYTQGKVTDFLEFVFVSFPVFNMADVLIDVGIGLIAIAMFMSPSKAAETGTKAEANANG